MGFTIPKALSCEDPILNTHTEIEITSHQPFRKEGRCMAPRSGSASLSAPQEEGQGYHCVMIQLRERDGIGREEEA